SELLAEAIAELTPHFPAAVYDATTAAKVAAARELAAFRGRDSGTAVADPHASFVVALDPPADEPPLFLPRVVGLRPVDEANDALTYLQRHHVTLEALAVSERRADLVEMATQAGASRVTHFGELQAPPLGAFHGGRPRIAEFVR